MHNAAASPSAQEPSSSVVFEHVCLFTRDIKRKQKRWQDGRLKFHAFNKRIMVYDDRGNFLGDSHWREDYEFGDGEEFQLERGAVLVQTAECVSSHRQDLSELIDKRVQEKIQRQSAAAARSPRPGTAQVSPQTGKDHFQLRHTPLLSVLGTPSGHHGRALVPSDSPYEQKQKSKSLQLLQQGQNETPEPARLRRREASPTRKSGYATSLFGATLTLSGRPMSSAPSRNRPRSIQLQPPEQPEVLSSNVSNQDRDQDEGSAVLPQPRNQGNDNAPLAERRATTVNIPRAQSAVQAENKVKPRTQKQVNQTNVITSDVVDLTTDIDNQRRPKPSHRENLAKEPKRLLAKRIEKLVATDMILREHVEKPAPPEIMPKEQPATAREPRIELRMAPSKKRGLLFLSEKSSTKSHRTSKRPRAETDSDHDALSRTTSEPSVNSSTGTDQTASINREPKSAPTRHEEKTYGQTPAVTAPDSIDHGELVELSISSESPQQSARAPAGTGSNGRARQADTASYNSDAMSSTRCKNSRDQSAIQPLPEKELAEKATHGEISQGREQIIVQESFRGLPFSNQQRIGATHLRAGDFDEIISRRPQNAPPPRLAKLRNSIRSREVIGLFSEDFQPSAFTTENGAGDRAAKDNSGPWSREAHDLFEYRRPE
ncbi:hypothetical protein PFICI_02817 [Pestalotiopsis fici W106-1]|uniref:5'-3' DNA helicase ZGRF1-like N-terminal domain-containing protein n=1 Tax=Pestalotiopsis fici (strain W106-1 / CGMCC3.15140) TaxID=1229662 RepID=W3XH97_PESFW|nr:uncharacterized protein PFICI_02817 [Pestalotiopsis fici W106-1]ETS84792.1 hypothetical protein PFICI_02817 [Pestalotiopsis fici W106-1]